MRANLFFALQLSSAAQAAVHEDALKWQSTTNNSHARWYAPEDYHLTLKFLGARESCEIDAFAGQAGELVAGEWRRAGCGAVAVQIAGAGGFPTLDSPRVLWAGARASAALANLAARLDTACAALGAPAEQRAYKPHVTLARVRESRRGPERIEPPPNAFQAVPNFVAARFVLMQTSPPHARKSARGVRYNIVHTFDLTGG